MISKTNGRLPGPIDELPPFPEGWYFIASRESILREKLDEGIPVSGIKTA